MSNHDSNTITSTNNEAQASYLGLISETDFHRPELYGFEVDMDGKIVAPDFRPDSDCAAQLRAAMEEAA